MADIDNPQVKKFCNEQIRTLADAATQYYYAAEAVVNEWEATGIDALITDTTDTIVDGSVSDGRTPITGAKVHGLINHVESMLVDLTANNNQKLNILLQIAVANGSV